MKKGNCFDVAGRMVMDNRDMVLCHGIVAGQGELKGRRIDHAWCELQDVVFDFSNGRKHTLRKERYYKIGKISKVKRYNSKEACKLMLKIGHFGPW